MSIYRYKDVHFLTESSSMGLSWPTYHQKAFRTEHLEVQLGTLYLESFKIQIIIYCIRSFLSFVLSLSLSLLSISVAVLTWYCCFICCCFYIKTKLGSLLHKHLSARVTFVKLRKLFTVNKKGLWFSCVLIYIVHCGMQLRCRGRRIGTISYYTKRPVTSPMCRGTLRVGGHLPYGDTPLFWEISHKRTFCDALLTIQV